LINSVTSFCALRALRPAGEGGWIGSWAPGIGDPTVVGWVTVGLYFVAALVSLRVGWGRGQRLARSERFFYRGLTVALFALGVNKQLDLQTALTELGRIMASEEGWYEQRRRVQRVFILLVGLVAFAGAGTGLFFLRRAPRATHVTLLGVIGLVAFVLIRASSFHHVDLFIRSSWWGIKGNWLIEVGSILVVIAGSVWRSLSLARS